MKFIGLDDFAFATFDQEKVKDGKQLAKIGKIYSKMNDFLLIERSDREREILATLRDQENGFTSGMKSEGGLGGFIYSSKYFIENSNSNYSTKHY